MGTTKYIDGRVKHSFIASKVGRRLVMFQVWFMKNNQFETLKEYNDRLGRPRIEVRNNVVSKAKYILNIKSYWDYFKDLDISLKDGAAIDQMLRFAVYQSYRRGYHLNKFIDRRMAKYVYPKIKAPVFTVYDKNGYKKQNILGVSNKVHIKSQKNDMPKSKKIHIKSQNKSMPKSEIVQKENEKQKLSKSQRRKNRRKKNGNKDQNHS